MWFISFLGDICKLKFSPLEHVKNSQLVWFVYICYVKYIHIIQLND